MQKDLTECQLKAFNIYKQYISDKKRKDKHITINGRGGTGKTYLAEAIKDHAIENNLNIMFAAPTHAARRELEKSTGIPANTIHSILKISPTTYEDQSIFEQTEVPDLSQCDILICDEGSMYDKELFNICMGTISNKTLVIALGDDAQFRPVSIDNPDVYEKKSRFFTDPRFLQIELLENKRNSGALLDICDEVREGMPIRQYHKDGTGVLTLDFNKTMAAYFKIIKTPDDLMNNRLVSFTNSVVDRMNHIIRERIYETKSPFILNEILVLQEPVSKTYRYEGKNITEAIYNNGENVEIQNIQSVRKPITARGIKETLFLEFFELRVESLDTGVVHDINVISEKQEFTKLAGFLNHISMEYKTDATKRRFWPDFWSIKSQFTNVKALPASTIHKSQGATFDNIFYLRAGLQNQDLDLIQQADYVSISRARRFAFVN